MSTNWTWDIGVKALRDLRDWTQTDLAEAAGVPQSLISRIERGDRKVSERSRIKIAQAFGVIPHKLFPYLEAVEDTQEIAS